MYLGENIRLLREAMKMNQHDFGLIFNVSRGQISNYENDINDPSVESILKLEEMAGMPFRRLCKKKLNPEAFASIPGIEGLSQVMEFKEEPGEYKPSMEGRIKKLESFMKRLFPDDF